MAAVLTLSASTAPNANITVLSATPAVIPPVTGTVYLTKAGVIAATLAAPAADGIDIVVFDSTGEVHTITTPTNNIQGTDDTATFAGTIGDYIHLRSFGGQWQMLDERGITLSEV